MDPHFGPGAKNGQKFLPPPKGCLVYLQKIVIFQKSDQRVPGLSTKKGPQKKPTPTQGPPFYTELVPKWGPKGAWFIYKKRAKIGLFRFWVRFWGPKKTPFLALIWRPKNLPNLAFFDKKTEKWIKLSFFTIFSIFCHFLDIFNILSKLSFFALFMTF
jgi:hypothetical protein